MSYSLFGREEGLHREAWDFKGCIIGGLGVVVFKASWCSPWLRNWICRINKRKSNRIALQNKPMKRYVIYTEIEKKVWRHFSCIDLYVLYFAQFSGKENGLRLIGTDGSIGFSCRHQSCHEQHDQIRGSTVVTLQVYFRQGSITRISFYSFRLKN